MATASSQAGEGLNSTWHPFTTSNAIQERIGRLLATNVYRPSLMQNWIRLKPLRASAMGEDHSGRVAAALYRPAFVAMSDRSLEPMLRLHPMALACWVFDLMRADSLAEYMGLAAAVPDTGLSF